MIFAKQNFSAYWGYANDRYYSQEPVGMIFKPEVTLVPNLT